MKKRNVMTIVGIVSFIIIVIGSSYAYFVYNRDVADISLNAGDISIDLADINGSLFTSNAVPMSDSEAIVNAHYVDFTVNATVDTEKIYYEVYIMPKSGNTLETSYLKVYLTDQNNSQLKEVTDYNSLSDAHKTGGKIIYSGVVNTNNNNTSEEYSEDFRLRIWVNESYTDITAKTFAFDVYLYAYNVANDFVLSSACPGENCVYSDGSVMTGVGSTLLDYSNTYTSMGNAFIGHIIDNNDAIVSSYACGINDNKLFCLKGGVNETSLDNKSVYIDNVDKLNMAFTSCGATTSLDSASCTGNISASINNNGTVSVTGSQNTCTINSLGEAVCS